ncbi:hypothetical protein [Sulfurimonas sp.]|jgi:hypothetical protein|uniref:hypothetical protein n=1 Tax=Sulfurimonas sp. TaxID=2022749 RepID=UPI0025F17D34|nr:hypothetical protein [Sulfurimonas sp.]MBT5934014.1 hypothetical protein [Sulfurimonas sp.]MBT7349988.1 hypothetical protein [candidate division WWE3 bacterium]
MIIPDNRTGFSMKVEGIHLTRPDLHEIAADLKIQPKDILFTNKILTIYTTSEACQEIVDDNALMSFVSMALDIPVEDLSELTAVKAKPKVLDMSDLLEDDEDDD